MKLIQTNDRIEIYSSSFSNLLLGIAFAAIGFYLSIYFYTKSTSLFPVFFGGIFAVVGVGLILFSKKRTVVIEKSGTTTVTDIYILTRQSKQQSIPTADIVGVSLSTYMQQNRNADGDTTRTRSSTLSLLLKNNDLIEIAATNNSGFKISGVNLASLITKAPFSKEAEQIATFLGVPLKANNLGLF